MTIRQFLNGSSWIGVEAEQRVRHRAAPTHLPWRMHGLEGGTPYTL